MLLSSPDGFSYGLISLIHRCVWSGNAELRKNEIGDLDRYQFTRGVGR